LLSGSGLTHRYIGDRSIALLAASPGTAASTQPQVAGTGGADNAQEGKGNSSGSFRVAQVDQGQSSSPSTVEKKDEQASTKKPVQLEEVVVTGSRIPRRTTEGAQEVKIYSNRQIEQSGQTTVADFLNTSPDVSISIGESGTQTFGGATTVQLHGLPIGTTLVLINGRRVETSGAQSGGDFFDLNTVPLAAVERIEVISEGSSAVYGSDAIAGVVNIILKTDFNGFEVSSRYGQATRADESIASLAWGKQWSKGSVSVMGSYQTRTELQGFDRALTSNNDYRPFGGIDARSFECSPGNVFSLDGSNLPGVGAPFAAVPHGFTGPATQREFAGTAGTLNECSLAGYQSLVPETRRAGVLAAGNYRVAPAVELLREVMYSNVKQVSRAFPPGLYGQPGFQR